ncbi:hypothetical protein RQP46_002103 [Phenoliferia psychrophenolica]
MSPTLSPSPTPEPTVPAVASDFAGLNPSLEKAADSDAHLPSTISLDSPTTVGLTYAEYSYKPTFEIDRKGNIVSHDPVLNSSPVALLSFLQNHSSTPPTITVQIRDPASLTEIDSPTTNSNSTTSPPVLHASYFVDLFDAHAGPATQTPPVTAAYEPLARASADRADDVRLAVEQFCSSRSVLKELTVVKETYGYNWEAVVAGVRAKVLEVWDLPEGIVGSVDVQINSDPKTITIRPNNSLAWTFSESRLHRFLLSAVLAYPLICAAELVLGARFDHFRATSPLVRWKVLPVPQDGSFMTEEAALQLASTLDARRPPKVAVLPDGTWVYLVGLEEGEWLRKWEGAIEEAVRTKKRGRYLLREVKEEVAVPALRGY